jgi:hypothetical protein
METKNKEDIRSKLNNRQVCRALISPVADGQDWDFEAVAIPTENKQLRYSWENDEYFYQVLRTAQQNIETARMDSGLPLFDNHPWEQSALNTLGISVGYEFTAQGIVMRVKLGARADDELKSDIQNKILKTVSIEGDVLDYTIERKENQIPIYYAERWEPTSLSLAPVPQDISAQIEIKRALATQLSKTKPPKDDSFIEQLIKKF